MAAIGNGGVGKLLTDKNVFHQKKHLFLCYFIKQNSTPSVRVVLVVSYLSPLQPKLLYFFEANQRFRTEIGKLVALKRPLLWRYRSKKDKEGRKRSLCFLSDYTPRSAVHFFSFKKTQPTGATIGNEKGH